MFYIAEWNGVQPLHRERWTRIRRCYSSRLMRVRQVVELLGHNRTFKRRLPDEFGGLVFFPSTEGGLKLLKPDITTADPTLTRFAREHVRPGQVVWDIGANVGLFTFLAAGRIGPEGRVLAVDADTWLIGNLRRGAAANPNIPIDVCPLPSHRR